VTIRCTSTLASRRAGRVPARRASFLDRSGTTISTLDLFGGNFALLSGPAGDAWQAVAGRLGVALDCHAVGTADLADPEKRFTEAYGISPSGAVVVRLDGFVGWRAAGLAAGGAEEILREVLAALLCREQL
jgi:putative polyketide hydroxylase